MSRVDLLMKLSLEKDQRTNSGEVNQHSVRHAMSVFSDNLRKMFLTNIMYVLVFALPFLFLAFIAPALIKDWVFKTGDYNFMGQVGIGYPGEVNTMSEGYKVLFGHYFRIYIPLLSASVIPLFVGLSGLFHCLRGYMWGENVRPVVSFFRGVKKLWKPFLITGVVFAAFICGVLYGATYHISLVKQGAANGGTVVLFIGMIVLTWLFVGVLTYLFPMFACYRYKFFDAVKNSVILALVNWLPCLFTSAFTIGIFCLSFANTAFNYIVLILLFIIGFAFLGGIWTSSAQKAFANFIIPQYESERSGGGLRIEARRGVNPYKAKKAKQKAAEGTAVGKASQMRAQGAEGENASPKKKKTQTKYVSYKRKK